MNAHFYEYYKFLYCINFFTILWRFQFNFMDI